MDQIIISGGHPLEGTVKVSGAKNAALPILASSLLGGECIVTNVPRVVDVTTMCKLLSIMGAGVSVRSGQKDACLRPRPRSLTSPVGRSDGLASGWLRNRDQACGSSSGWPGEAGGRSVR